MEELLSYRSGGEEDLEAELRQSEQEIENLKNALEEADIDFSAKHDKLIAANEEILRLEERVAALKFQGTGASD